MLHIKEFREEHGIYASQVVEVVRERYPGYDKYLNSKVENFRGRSQHPADQTAAVCHPVFSAGCQRRCLTSCNRRSAPLALTPCRPACNI